MFNNRMIHTKVYTKSGQETELLVNSSIDTNLSRNIFNKKQLQLFEKPKNTSNPE